MRKPFLLFPLVILFAGCEVVHEDDVVSVEVVKVHQIFGPEGRVAGSDGVWIAVLRNYDAISISEDIAKKMSITPAWYAISIFRYPDGAMQAVTVTGPIEPMRIKQKRIVEKEGEPG